MVPDKVAPDRAVPDSPVPDCAVPDCAVPDCAVPDCAVPDGPDSHVPDSVASVAAGRTVRLVWANEAGGLTFRVGADDDCRFVKWAPAGSAADLRREAARMVWAASFTPVPRVLGEGADAIGNWLITAGLPGEMAVAPRWLADPGVAVTSIGRGLRALHERLPVESCPFSWMADDRLADARRRAAAGVLDPANWNDIHQPLGIDGALAAAADIPPVDMLVVCHGDPCAPNTLLADDGRWSAHVDLGDLGVADRWADLAVATWSCEWNYGAAWEPVLLDAYGIQPDPARTRYYRLLWDLGP